MKSHGHWNAEVSAGLPATLLLILAFSVAVSGCHRIVAIQPGTNLVPIDAFGGTFELPPPQLDPPVGPRDHNAPLNPAFTYWLAAGDQLLASWSEYSVNWPCVDRPITNVCNNAPPDFLRDHLPTADCRHPDLTIRGQCIVSGGCPRVWLFEGQSLDSSSRTVFSASPKSVPEGCSPSTVSFTPTQDATFALWASERTDIPQNYPADSLGDKSGSTLNVSFLQPGMPRIVVKRRPLTQICGPSTASFPQSQPCSSNPRDDPTESHWAIDMTQFSLNEGFSSSLRVKEVQVFASEDGMAANLAFCAVQASQPNSRVGSDCDASMGPQRGACKAPLSADLTPASPGWYVIFHDAQRQPDGSTIPSKCPNDPNRATVWLEFTLEKRP